MPDEKEEEKTEKTAPKTGEFTLRRAGKVVLNYQEDAAKAPEGKQIHPRRFLPLVPEASPKEPSEEKEQDKDQNKDQKKE